MKADKNKMIKRILIITALYTLVVLLIAIILNPSYPVLEKYRHAIAIILCSTYLIAIFPSFIRYVEASKKCKDIKRTLMEIEQEEEEGKNK